MNVVICYWCNWLICPIIVETVVSPFYSAAQWAAHQWGIHNKPTTSLRLPLCGLTSHLHPSVFGYITHLKLVVCGGEIFIKFIKLNWISCKRQTNKRFEEWLTLTCIGELFICCRKYSTLFFVYCVLWNSYQSFLFYQSLFVSIYCIPHLNSVALPHLMHVFWFLLYKNRYCFIFLLWLWRKRDAQIQIWSLKSFINKCRF